MTFKEQLCSVLSAAGVPVSERQLTQADRFTERLVSVNQTMNLTAITEPVEMAQKHWLDCLCPGALELPASGEILDVGCGAGFPGVPLKIFYPDLQFTLLDSLQKRLNFIREACEYADIDIGTLLHGRAEEYGRNKLYRQRYDVVVSRAVAALPTLSELCVPFLKVGGTLIAFKGPGAEQELQSAESALKKLGCRTEKVLPFTLPGGEKRNLIYIQKVLPTAPVYPRNSKAIKTKPL